MSTTPQMDTPSPIIRRQTRARPRWSITHWLIGRPLPTADAPHQTIGKAVGLAVFASDALSSTAYASQEILFILAAAGTAAFGLVFPISLVIVILLIIVTISYEQTIHAYPDGGGAYIVARDNLGETMGLMAASALLTDYILTVAVSIAAGAAQIVSAYPELFPYRVHLSVGLILFVMLVNLRGVRESGIAFSIPTYFFVAMMFSTVGVGLFRYFIGTLGIVTNPPPLEIHGELVAITPFLILHAFSSGTAALTGIEAISNGITAFKEPRSHNAGITLIWMAGILASLFLGISFLAREIQAIPSEKVTVISQLAETVFDGRGVMYMLVITATTVILIMAANTAFADFPRLSALVAKDGFLPRQLTYRGSRLVYSYGIVALALIASLLIVVFNASVTRLIPLYAIGVFLSFTLSQSGMSRRWWKIGHVQAGQEVQERGSVLRYQPGWQLKMLINGFGAICTFVVMIVFAVTKFSDGAWIVLFLMPTLMVLFRSIHRHYRLVASKLSLENFIGLPPHAPRHRVILLVSGVHQGSLLALRYARMLSDDVTAVHVVIDPVEGEKLQKRWEKWGDGVRLVLLDSPYRQLLEPLLEYLQELSRLRQPNEVITVVVPQFVALKPWERILHTQTAAILREELLTTPGIVVTDVPYLIFDVEEKEE